MADRNELALPLPLPFIRSMVGRLSRSHLHTGMITLTDQAVVSAANFLAGVMVGRNCSREEYGLYTLGFSIMVFVINLQGSLISLPYMVYSPQLPPDQRGGYTTSTLLHQLGLSLLAAAGLGTAALLMGGHGLPGLGPVVLVLATVMAAVLGREYARQISLAWLQPRTALTVDAGVALLHLAGMGCLALQGGLNASRAYGVYGAACAVASLAWLVLQRGRFSRAGLGVAADFGRNWRLGRWNLASGVANLAAVQIYPWLLTIFHGQAATGSLAACLGVAFLANPVVVGLCNFLLPRITHAMAQEGMVQVRRIVARGTLAIAAVMGLFCLVMAVSGGSLLGLIYGAKYQGLHLVVAVVASAQLVEALSLPLGGSLFALGRPDAGFKSYLVALLVTGSLGVWLVRSWGVHGVALGLLSANASSALYRWRAYRIASGKGGNHVFRG